MYITFLICVGSPEPDERFQLGGSLAQLMAHLVLIEALGARQAIGPEQMFNACAKGNIGAVNEIIQRKKDLVNSRNFSETNNLKSPIVSKQMSSFFN